MKVKDLTPHKMNPRKISEKMKKSLKKSIDEFGDLGGIVFNKSTNSLVSGHQRSSILDEGKIKIEKKFDPPTPTGTSAIGYIEGGNGERFSYREVLWDKKKETEAMLAANKIQGQWDTDLLRINFANVPDLDISLAGFDLEELRVMDIDIAPVQIEKVKISSVLSDDDEEEESDEDYLKNSAGPERIADRERLPDLINRTPVAPPEPEPVKEMTAEEAFDKVDEKTTVENKRIVLIIDCDTNDHKQAIKDLIFDKVKEAGGRFF